jgi:GTP-binding protein
MDASFILSAVNEGQYPEPSLPEIAFAGRSNVGKSSLINTLVNRRNLAKASSQPGRTRMINFFAVDGRIVLVDLPGYGFARVPPAEKAAWKVMVENYLRLRTNLRGVVVILDIRRDVSQMDLDLISWLNYYALPQIPVLTKADKLSRNEAAKRQAAISRQLASHGIGIKPALFSAKTRLGKEELWRAILDLLPGASSYTLNPSRP